MSEPINQPSPPPMRPPGRPEPQPTKNPRKVRGGVRLSSRERSADAWAAQHWLRVLEQVAAPEIQAEGLEYAKLGQARRLDYGSGFAEGLIQGRMPRAYISRLTITPYTEDQGHQVVKAMADSAVYAAKLLSRELPPSVEDLFAPLGLKLFPTGDADIKATCTCGGPPWCKHTICVAHLIADRLAADPTLMLLFRGLPMDELVERLRQLRARPDASQAPAPVYTPHVPRVASSQVALDQCLESFWEGESGHSLLDLPIEPPQVSHPLLRRLGPSPFQGAKFPLVGLLATCYEVISHDAIHGLGNGTPEDNADLGGSEPGNPDGDEAGDDLPEA